MKVIVYGFYTVVFLVNIALLTGLGIVIVHFVHKLW
jgi:hypothetical protein